MIREPVFGVDGGFAAHSGRGNRLPVDAVDAVASREHSRVGHAPHRPRDDNALIVGVNAGDVEVQIIEVWNAPGSVDG